MLRFSSTGTIFKPSMKVHMCWSVRAVVQDSEDAPVMMTRDYAPYGEVLAGQGTNPTPYGYTGEWTDVSGLVYLRARYYSPMDGRFTSKDIWQGNNNAPMSYNAWLYGYSNPVMFVDPSGHIPLLNQYDLTNWFYEELKSAENHVYVKQIRVLLSSVSIGGAEGLIDNLRGGLGWYFLVRDSAKWDFKHNIEERLQTESFIFQHEGGYDWYEYSMPGNIFYGYIGSAAGFSPQMLHLGAGYAEVKDPDHVKRGESCCPDLCTIADPLAGGGMCIALGCYYFNPAWKDTQYDDPMDYQAVEFGIRMYAATQGRISFSLFQTFLSNNRSSLTKGNPVSKSLWKEVYDDIYKPGYFDGPDTVKNAGTVDGLLLWPPLSLFSGGI